MQPGDTIKPHSKPDETAAAPVIRVTKTAPAEKPASKVETIQPPAEPPAQPETTQPETADVATSPWQYSSDNEAVPSLQPANIDPVTWSASEFIDHEKSTGWFMALAGLTVAAVALIYLITRDVITIIVVLLAAILFGITAKRKPRTLEYQLDHTGVHIADKFYPYEFFKTFAVLGEGAFNSIQLMPLKRFMPPISLYYPPENEEKIVNTLGSYLPHEERTHDPIERLMRKVRF